MMDGCKICGRATRAKGYCGAHYERVRQYGDPQAHIPIKLNKYPEGMKCAHSGCSELASDVGYCGMHAQRVRRYNDSNFITPEETRRMKNRLAQMQSKPADGNSYLKFYGKHEHRLVAEKHLGRELMDGEIVHHDDENKHNNSPDNLKVMSQSEHARIHMGRTLCQNSN